MSIIYLLYFSISIFIGFLSAIFGIGGGFLIVPVLSLLGLDIHHAIGTSSAAIIFSSFSAIIEYRKQGRINYRIGIMLALPSIFGAYSGAWITKFLNSSYLELMFGILLLAIAIRIWKQKIEVKEIHPNYILISIAGFFTGMLSGLLGIGGGIINVPIFSCLGLSIHSAIATSSFVIFFTSMASSIKHYSLGNVNFIWLIFLIPGLAAGAQIGAKVAKKIKARNLKNIFSIPLFILAFRMILKSIGMNIP